MLVFGGSRTNRVPGPRARIHCTSCGTRDVSAVTFTSEEAIRLYFIPLPKQREWHAVCSRCGADLLSRLPPHELAALPADTATRCLYHRPSIVAQALAVLGALVVCFPLVSVGLGGAAAVMSRRSRGWPFWLGVGAAVANVALWGGLILRARIVEGRWA